MLNPKTTEYSKNIIEEQKAYVLDAYPYIKQVDEVDPAVNLLADYIFGIDAHGKDSMGKSHTIQFKHRQVGNNDLVIPAKKFTGKNVADNELGFIYKGKRYTFKPTADIYVETINGTHYTFTASEVMAVQEVCPDLSEWLSGVQEKMFINDHGDKFPSGEYMAFVSPEKMRKAQEYLHNLKYSNDLH